MSPCGVQLIIVMVPPGRQTRMSRKGNDLVRKYLWNAARTGITPGRYRRKCRSKRVADAGDQRH